MEGVRRRLSGGRTDSAISATIFAEDDDAEGKIVRVWSRREKRPVTVSV